MSRVLVTGGAGFIGSNLADRLASEGHQVIVFDALVRAGVERNLAWLKARHGAKIVHMAADTRDSRAVGEAVRKAEAVFHLAAQVAVTTSLVDPVEDFAEGLAELAEWVARQEAEDRVVEARKELEMRGLVA
jgi:CDP-paratose 2-epimerase